MISKSFNCDESLEVRSVYLDMSKARYGMKVFYLNLNKMVFLVNYLNFFKNDLSDRKQRVALNGLFSDWGPIKSGVPQGSVLGQLLFLVFINVLEVGIKSSIKFFANDPYFPSLITLTSLLMS